MINIFSKFSAFLFIKGAEIIFIKNRTISGYIFLILVAFFGRLEIGIFNTFFLIGFYITTNILYILFFSLVFNNTRFADFTCKFLKANSEPGLFNSVIGNPAYHIFAAKIGGFSAKVLLKQSVGSFAIVGSGLLVTDHMFHESGAKLFVDTKVHFLNEQTKLDFALKNGLPYTPGSLPTQTGSIVRNLANFPVKKI